MKVYMNPSGFKSIDYAKVEEMNAWLRHPVLGDPSFDTFEKLGETVHKSEPPHEWAVNGSLFRDPADGAWYLFAGMYPYGYSMEKHGGKTIFSDFRIYKSDDAGNTWRDMGNGFKKGFSFNGYTV